MRSGGNSLEAIVKKLKDTSQTIYVGNATKNMIFYRVVFGKWKPYKYGDMLLFLSDDFEFEKLAEFGADKIWIELLDKALYALQIDFPEHLFSRELPEKQENESDFIALRRDMDETYQKFKPKSCMFGLKVDRERESSLSVSLEMSDNPNPRKTPGTLRNRYQQRYVPDPGNSGRKYRRR